MRFRTAVAGISTALCLGLIASACSSKPAEPPAPAGPEPLTLPADPANYAPNPLVGPMTIPADNPITVDKATLGWQLWFDKRLSGKGDRNCYGCHVNEKGLTDGLVKNTNANTGAPLPRHTPTMWNIGYHTEWYWDGRAKTLEGQALAAWKLANMGAKDPDADDKALPRSPRCGTGRSPDPAADIAAFLLKLAGQKQSYRYGTEMQTVVTKDLLLAILKGEITQPEQVAYWLDRNPPRM